MVVLVALLWRRLGHGSRTLRLGVLALGLAGALTVLDGVLPLSCARSLDPTCALDHDAIDVAHAIESVAVVVATAVSFWFVGRGGGGLALGTDAARAGQLERATRILGALWLLFTLAYAAKYAIDDLAGTKGLFQRGAQVAFGVWLAVLGVSRPLPPGRANVPE